MSLGLTVFLLGVKSFLEEDYFEQQCPFTNVLYGIMFN